MIVFEEAGWGAAAPTSKAPWWLVEKIILIQQKALETSQVL